MRGTSAPPASVRRRLALFATVPLLVASGALTATASAAGSSGAAGPLGVPAYSSFDPLDNGDPIQVRTLSSRADLVSGGDAFLEVVLPSGTDAHEVKVTVGDRDISQAFREGGPGLRGLVTGLPAG